jgi:hypothetical protein
MNYKRILIFIISLLIWFSGIGVNKLYVFAVQKHDVFVKAINQAKFYRKSKKGIKWAK